MSHEGIESILPDELLQTIRQNVKRHTLKLGDMPDDTRVEIEAFMTGALFFRAVIVGHHLTIRIEETALLQAAQEFYSPYDPLTEPTKANESGNAPPLAIPKK